MLYSPGWTHWGLIASLQLLTQGHTLYCSVSLALIPDNCRVTALWQTVHLCCQRYFATWQLWSHNLTKCTPTSIPSHQVGMCKGAILALSVRAAGCLHVQTMSSGAIDRTLVYIFVRNRRRISGIYKKRLPDQTSVANKHHCSAYCTTTSSLELYEPACYQFTHCLSAQDQRVLRHACPDVWSFCGVQHSCQTHRRWMFHYTKGCGPIATPACLHQDLIHAIYICILTEHLHYWTPKQASKQHMLAANQTL